MQIGKTCPADTTEPRPGNPKYWADYQLVANLLFGLGKGGMGSGRRWGCQTKGRVEQCPALDIRRLHRDELLRPGQSYPYHWSRNGERAAAIEITTMEDRVVLSYQRLLAGGEWQSEQYPVLLERLPCNYGGQRAWFRCPENGCGRRVAILYGNGIFACRHCHRLAYSSQAWDRALRRAQAIRQRLGGTANMYDPFPARPKWMHAGTYLGLRRQHDEANAHSWPGWLRRWRPSRAKV
jgi:hypothetical protein